MQISLYTTPNCPQCRITKKMLDDAGVQYELVDLSKDAGAMEMVKELGYVAAPVVITETKHWSGFRHDQIIQAIAQYNLGRVHAA
jgi:glutaredoxin-like protein NrdH